MMRRLAPVINWNAPLGKSNETLSGLTKYRVWVAGAEWLDVAERTAEQPRPVSIASGSDDPFQADC